MNRLLMALACLVAVPAAAHAVPTTVSFTGRLSDDAGPLDGAVTLEVALYDQAVGGTSRWSEAHTTTATGGFITLALGSQLPLGPSVFDGGDAYLAITVNGAVLSPRTQVRAVPYATRAAVATTSESLGSLTEGDVQRRVVGACPAGSAIQAIDTAGMVSCEAGGSGDITGVTVTGGLTGGGTSGAVSIGVNTAVIQARVAGSCPAGQSIRIIDAAGNVTCEVDNDSGGDITAVTAGAGLTGGATTGAAALAVNTTVIQSRVTGTCASGSSIDVIGSTGAVSCGPRIASGSITAPLLCNSFNSVSYGVTFSTAPSVVVTPDGLQGLSGFPNSYCVTDLVTTTTFRMCCLGNIPETVRWIAIGN